MEPLLISDEPNWVLKAIRQLEQSERYGNIETDNGFVVLPLPTPDNVLLAGYAKHDAPSAALTEQKVMSPQLVFFAKYPGYQFAERPAKPFHDVSAVEKYTSLFGKSESFSAYYFHAHSNIKHTNEYYRLVSEVLAHHWLANQSVLTSTPEQIQETARAIAPFFKGAPVNLRDFYIQEGKSFLDWLLQHL